MSETGTAEAKATTKVIRNFDICISFILICNYVAPENLLISVSFFKYLEKRNNPEQILDYPLIGVFYFTLNKSPSITNHP